METQKRGVPGGAMLGDEPFDHLLGCFDDSASLESYEAGARLFNEQESPRGIYLIVSGNVELSVSARGQKRWLRSLRPGDLVGIDAAFSGKPHEMTAETLQGCVVRFASRERFLEHLRHYPSSGLAVLQLLSKDVRNFYDTMRLMAAS